MDRSPFALDISRTRRTAVLALIAACSSFACADDWLMFRKDAGRTASSKEEISLPLKQAWSWTSQRVYGVSPLSTTVVRDGFAYFVSGARAGDGPAKGRLLVCVDLKTGKAKWSKELVGTRVHPYLPEDIGPAISEKGTVFVVEFGTVFRPCPTATVSLKAFAPDGTFIEQKDLPLKNSLDRLFLREGDGQHNHLLTPFTKPDT